MELLKQMYQILNENEKLFNLLTIYQVHLHSKSCTKYNNNCSYNFWKFFSNSTIVVVLLPDRMPHDEKNIILQKRETTLSTVQEYINDKLDPRKVNTLKPDSHVLENFCQIKIFPSLVRKNVIICLFRVENWR